MLQERVREIHLVSKCVSEWVILVKELADVSELDVLRKQILAVRLRHAKLVAKYLLSHLIVDRQTQFA